MIESMLQRKQDILNLFGDIIFYGVSKIELRTPENSYSSTNVNDLFNVLCEFHREDVVLVKCSEDGINIGTFFIFPKKLNEPNDKWFDSDGSRACYIITHRYLDNKKTDFIENIDYIKADVYMNMALKVDEGILAQSKQVYVFREFLNVNNIINFMKENNINPDLAFIVTTVMNKKMADQVVNYHKNIGSYGCFCYEPLRNSDFRNIVGIDGPILLRDKVLS